jgi:hypothetical protein
MGDRLIDVENITKFKISLNNKIYIINLAPRKRKEKNWLNVAQDYLFKLESATETTSKLERLCKNFETFATKSLFSKCLFFLKEVPCDS